MKMTVRKIRRDREGRINYYGEIMCKKVDVEMVDCTVTGADSGKLDAPNLSLKSMCEEHISPEIAVLVDPGGYFEGYLTIFQGDNTGPHICAILHN